METKFNIIKIKYYDWLKRISQESKNIIISDKIEIVLDGNFIALRDEDGQINIGNRIYFIADDDYKLTNKHLEIEADNMIFNFKDIEYITCVDDNFIILQKDNNIDVSKNIKIIEQVTI